MKRLLLLLALAALSVGCDDGYSLGGTQGLSTEPTVWRGSHGTAVTIRFATGTERLEGAQEVTFRVDQWYPSSKYWYISKFAVPVMKLEPRAVTLFFSEGKEDPWGENAWVLRRLPDSINARTVRVVPLTPTIAEALKRHHVALTRSALVAALQNSNQEVRGLAAAELAEEKAIEVVPDIVQALTSEHIPLTRVNIALALARLGNEKGVKTLESACHESETVAGVRMTAATYMVNFLHRNACFSDVLDVLDSRDDDQAGNHMQALSLAPSFKGLSEDESLRLLTATINNLGDTTAAVRIYASYALVRLGDASAVPYLQRALSVERDHEVRNAMKDALKRLQQQE